MIGKALARLNTGVEPWNFTDGFAEKIIHDAQRTITLFVSPNGYSDFLELLERCEKEKVEYIWFYPYNTVAEPEVPDSIKKHVQFVRLKR